MSKPVCKFCGQYVGLGFELLDNEKMTEERAVLLCNCDEAHIYQKEKDIERKEALKRERVLKAAEEKIQNLFGADSDEYNDRSKFKNVIIEILNKSSVLVYDQYLKKMSLAINADITAVITKTKDGLKIKRQDKDNVEIEIK